MLAGVPTKSVSTTVEDVTKSYIFGPDCVVEAILPEATVDLVKAVEVDRYRVIAINDHPVSDSGELKSALQQAGAAEATEHPVLLTFQYADVHAEKVSIENSVLFNGAQSAVAEPNTAAVEEYIASITEPPSHRDEVARSTNASTAEDTTTTKSTLTNASSSASEATAAVVKPLDAAALAQFDPPKLASQSQSPSAGNNASSSTSFNSTSTQSPLFHLERTEDDSTPVIGSSDSQLAPPAAPPRGQLSASAAQQHTPTTPGATHHMQPATSAHDNTSSNTPDPRFASPSHEQHGDTATVTSSSSSAGQQGGADTGHVAQTSTKVPPPPLSDTALAATPRAPSSVVVTLRQRFMDALARVRPGCCVICLVQEFNPIAEIELLAMTAQRPVISIDLSVKLKRRAKPDEVAAQFAQAMRSGAWFVLLNAHKSMNACAVLRDALVEARAAGLPQFDPHARIVISLEQHPHFPKPLIECAVVLKLVASFEGSVVLSDSVATPSLRSRLITAEMMSASQFDGIMTKQPSLTSQPRASGEAKEETAEKATYDSHAAAAPAALATSSKNTNSNNTNTNYRNIDRSRDNNANADGSNTKGTSSSSSSSRSHAAGPNSDAPRHVRISAAVDIIDIPAREVTEKADASHRGTPAAAGRGAGADDSQAMHKSIDVSGSVVLTKSYKGIVGDKFLCVQLAGTADRYAVGSSLGNVYFLDSLGNALMQTHAHDASIWDVSFASKYDFATGSEDGTARTWSFSAKHDNNNNTNSNSSKAKAGPTSTHDAKSRDSSSNNNNNNNNNNSNNNSNKSSTSGDAHSLSGAGDDTTMFDDGAAHSLLMRTSTTHLQADVYCATYLRHRSDATSPLICAGLQSTLLIRDTHRGDEEANNVTTVAISSNAQVLDCMPSYGVCVVGCGNGSVCAIDIERATVLLTSQQHNEKVPAIAVRDDNQFFSGSFDSCILSWDLRVPRAVVGAVNGTANAPPAIATSAAVAAAASSSEAASLHSVHTLKLRNYVTGVSVQDVNLTACVGENLYIWDVRNLNTVLGGYPQGWKGLTRGVVLQSETHSIVTASQDGMVRFWTFI